MPHVIAAGIITLLGVSLYYNGIRTKNVNLQDFFTTFGGLISLIGIIYFVGVISYLFVIWIL